MKRANDLFPELISDDNILSAIKEVNRTHRVHKGRPNKVVAWVEETLPERVKEIRKMLTDGFKPNPVKRKRRYDHSAGKWRDICEPLLYPDQYVHHAVIQVLQPVMMRGMDYWCCGSIRGRGTIRGINGIKKWFKNDRKNTKYAAELDIYHFYDSLTSDVVMNRLRELVKDERMLSVVDCLLDGGIMIGAYYSQWFANTALQPLDHMIRQKLKIKHYVRYMDNITLFGGNKKKLHKAVKAIDEWLGKHGMRLKGNHQVFRTDKRAVTAMGYRFDSEKTLLRKRTLLRLKRKLTKFYKAVKGYKLVTFRAAAGLISRLGMLKHCDCRSVRERYVKKGTEAILKGIVRQHMLEFIKIRGGANGLNRNT